MFQFLAPKKRAALQPMNPAPPVINIRLVVMISSGANHHSAGKHMRECFATMVDISRENVRDLMVATVKPQTNVKLRLLAH